MGFALPSLIQASDWLPDKILSAASHLLFRKVVGIIVQLGQSFHVPRGELKIGL